MSETIKKRIGELFEPINGNSKYTKAYCQNNPGEYIVYTGTTIGIFGKINKADYTTPQLTFTTDGENAGTIEYITDKGFCVGGHRTVLKPLVENIDLLYFKYILQPLFYQNVKKGDVPSLHFSRIKNLRIQIPALPDGSLNLEKQKELAQKYKDIEDKKKKLLDKIEFIKNNKIIFDENDDIEYVNINLNDAIIHQNGKATYTKEWCQEHSGNIPLYSANNSRPIATMDKADYDGKFLTYSKNGCAGYITILNGKFSVNGDRCVMTLNKEYKNIDLLYLKYYLEPIFRANIKGRIGINGKNEYTKLNSTMIKKLNIQVPIPIDDNGKYDLKKQQELAQKYATIETIKQNLYSQVKELVSITIN